MSNLIDGKLVSEKLRDALTKETAAFIKQTQVIPHLVVIIVGQDPASMTYVRNKKKACEAIGFKSTIIELEQTVTEAQLLEVIEALNQDEHVHGILVQLPLPKHINEDHVVAAIDVLKDVDGFHPYQIGCLAAGIEGLTPCTPTGVMQLLKAYDVDITGKHAVILGRSNIVGKPLIQLLLQEDATVTICHSKTQNLAEITRQADILIAAIGQAHFVTATMIKTGAVIVDVGINRLESGKLVGDVDFDNVAAKARYITPVPGGVGPMTITMLLKNTLKAAKSQREC